MGFLEQDLAYTAGLVDGEGCILITKWTQQRDPNTSPAAQYRLKVQVTNCDPEICYWLKDTFTKFTGCVSVHVPLKPWKTRYVWAVTGKKASKFLEVILPFLKVKRPQALLAIDYQNKKSLQGLTSRNTTWLEEQRKQMHQLNKRGR